MATKSFLTQEELHQAARRFEPISTHQEGVGVTHYPQLGKEFSVWLGAVLLEKFTSMDSWVDAGAIALGSWARDELCPLSDIDVLFCGNEKAALEIVRIFQEQGLKLRYRLPEDIEDWTKGVLPFDVLALLHARAFDWQSGEKLSEQQAKIRARGSKYLKDLVTSMHKERAQRLLRYDSVSNFLQPNLKYGPGGLRDLQQGQAVCEIFPDKFPDAHHAQQVLDYYRSFFLSVRQKLHLIGGGEVLTANEQLDLTHHFGFEDIRDFMREIQIGLSRISFYTDWIFARALSSRSQIMQVESAVIKTPQDVFKALAGDPSRLMQARVRSVVETVFAKAKRKSLGKLLNHFFSVSESENFLIALFRSRSLEQCVPELERVKGWVQHDHYHRFTVDAHLMQAVREVKRVFDKPKTLGRMADLVKELDDKDWKILLWTALYHDLGKGREGDHSSQGAELVKEDFTQMGLSLRMTLEVTWLVQNHLILSTAAFRKNPNSTSTWKDLLDRGVKGKRLLRLAVFTAVDIRATNPEAWTDWKEKLLRQLVAQLRSPQGTQFMQFLERAEAKKLEVSREFVSVLDPFVLESLPTRVLIKDYEDLKSLGGDLVDLVVRNQSGEIWIRFHRRQDKKGLFLGFVQKLYSCGCVIRQSSVRTMDLYGVYDWFQVKTSKSPAQLRKLLSILPEQKELNIPSVHFEKIEMVSQDENEVIYSFRGKDQKGLLLAAAYSLHSQGLFIRWAKVHTWGQQIEDIFAVSCPDDPQLVLNKIKLSLVPKP